MNKFKLTELRSILIAFKSLLVVAATLFVFGCGGGAPTGFDPDFHLIIPQTAPVAFRPVCPNPQA